MRNDNEINERAVMALIEWGKTNLISPHLEDYLKELRGDFNSLLENGTLGDILETVYFYAEKNVKKAKDTLINKELITASPYDGIAEQTQEALNAFDEMIFLDLAIRHLIKPSEKKESILNKLDNIISDISSFMYDEDWSPLRLAPINRYRRELLNIIPEDEKYQFPWYELFCEYDENTISTLIFNYHMLSNKKYWGKLSEDIKDRIPEIVHELKRDKKLLKEIVDGYKILSGLSTAVAEDKRLLLWHSAEKESEKYPVKQAVANLGIVRVSTRLLQDVPIETESNKIYWLFLIAFCAPEISNYKRIEFFDYVERGISMCDTESASEDKKELLVHLKSWFHNKYEDKKLAKESYQKWNSMLHKIATPENFNHRVFDKDADDDALLSEVVRIYNSSSSLPPDYIEAILEYIRYIRIANAIQEFRIHAGRAGVPRGGEGAEGDNLFQADKPIEILCSAENNGYLLLPDPGRVSGANSEKYSDLYTFISSRRDNTVFCGGWLNRTNHKYEKLDTIYTLGGNTVFIQRINAVDNSYNKALLCLTDNNENLEKILMSGIENAQQFIEKAKEMSIVILIITFV